MPPFFSGIREIIDTFISMKQVFYEAGCIIVHHPIIPELVHVCVL